MRNEALSDELKTRVPKQDKKRFREIAESRHLKVSDIMREAIREKIERDLKQKSKLPA
jgi:predicted transcriptional regulator